MAFHVACPITCRRVCFCTLGFPQKLKSEKGRNNFLDEIFRVEEFLNDPWSIKAKGRETIQVTVPKIEIPIQPVVTNKVTVVNGFGNSDVFRSGASGDGDNILSIQKKQASLQKKAVVPSLAAEEFARRFETGSLLDISREKAQDLAEDDQDSSATKIECKLCSSGENEGSERAVKMLACKICSRKYHRSCIKHWAQHRDLFHWSSWACPFCRTCELCRRAGEPTKLMFCKRCDGAHHCYCQQPPHKNVSSGPYLCPKHTKCHSCASTVPGSGQSTRWFLGYNYCDACGRLFVKGKYCPVCLKVYRDSESTPMVCCDVCERWVHCQCDGISDEKYLQFQVDGNLYYKCAACRGECYQVKDHDDAIQELWRRRDHDDQEQIASLRAAAGLPSQEEIFSISPYSDDEENVPVGSKTVYGRSLKISVKGLADKTTKNPKEHGKKTSNNKYMKKKGYKVSSSKTVPYQNFERPHYAQSLDYELGDERNDDVQSFGNERKIILSPHLAIGSGDAREKCIINQAGSVQHGLLKPRHSHGLDLGEGSGRHASKSETMKGKKLVIHLNTRNRNIASSPVSEASSCHKEQDLMTSNGSEDTSQNKAYLVEPAHDGIARFGDDKGEKVDGADLLKGSGHRSREGNLIKFGKVKSDFPEVNKRTGGGNIRERHDFPDVEKTRVSLGRGTEESTDVVEPITEGTTSKNDDVLLKRHSKSTPNVHGESHDKKSFSLESLPRDPKPLLKFKFKNPYVQNRSSWVPQGEEEKTSSSIKGQRSKRKRPSPTVEKTPRENEGYSQLPSDSQIDEAIDANWILKKLGKDAIGKRVEVHQSTDSSWHKGVVTDAIEGTSTIAVRLDDGNASTLELEKQRVRFVSHKQKRSKI